MPDTRVCRTPDAPLAETLSRIATVEVDEIDLSAGIGVPDDPAWVEVSRLASDSDLLDELLGRIGQEYETSDRLVTVTFLLRGCLWRVLTPAVAAFLLDRRLPDLSAQNVALSFDQDGYTSGLVLREGRYAALPTDPAAGHPDAVVLSSDEEVLAWGQNRLAEHHLLSLFDALRCSRPRRGKRALWGTAVDVICEAFMYVGRWLGRQQEALEYAESMLSGDSPLSGPTNYFTLEYGGGSELTRVRNTCCLYYKLGDGTCFTCPRTSDEERIRRLAEREMSEVAEA
jgi:ferric iron reductase protein FhuF